jgi:acyl CoA:acetate/3-ketoacid CoA transferase alpha subunit
MKYWTGDQKTVESYSKPKLTRVFDGQKYLQETALHTQFSFIKGCKADTLGNVQFNSAWNFNSDVAMAGGICICEADEIVPAGEIPPESVDLPGIFVKRLIKSTSQTPSLDLKVF